MTGLFSDADGKEYSAEDIRTALHEVGAHDCDALFVHSDVMFGKPAAGFRRREYLNTLYQLVQDLHVAVLVPTFTYSFCNHEDYDVRTSKTSMGAFSEYVRNLDGRYRTLDPLLSVSVPVELKAKFENVGPNSLGANSGLDALHGIGGVKFLFLGADMAGCFTYVHYVEKMLDVPYRFDMEFEGNVTDYSGKTVKRQQFIHTQCGGVKLPERYGYFEADLLEKGILKQRRIGDKFISCISEPDAFQEIKNNIEKDINYYLEIPFTEKDLTHIYTYDYTKARITHC